MSQNYLLEIGLEEIPAHVVTPSINQLVERMTSFLKENRLSFDKIEAYSTPRRLALKVIGLADKQEDIEELAKGPAKKIAYDKDGNWSKAAQGFARGQGVSVDELFFQELKGVEYVYVKKFIAGKSAKEVLTSVKEVVMEMKFPTMMRWGSNDFEYVRPIRWIVSLLNDEIVSFKVLDLETGRKSQGHRFLGKEVEVRNADAYPECLKQEMVIADAKERKEIIMAQIDELANKNSWNIVVDPDLLEEVNNLVEYPTVFAGSFDEKYLSVPDAVLITSMKDNQRYFYVEDSDGRLLPHFVSVRNGNDAYLENVVSGNEKVLTARLEDAKFFYEEDQKQTISDYVERLKKVMFHDKIGTIYEKMERVALIAAYLGKHLGLSETQLADLKRAAMIYKFDLVTGMVGEFSELQGVMGEIYASLFGETDAVASAMREEYMPTSSEGDLPESTIGAVLSIADKADSIQAFFSAGMIPSGSNDPYALRRQALGIVRIALDKGWSLSVPLLHEAIMSAFKERGDLYANIDPEKNYAGVKDFMFDRVAQIIGSNNAVGRDALEAALANKDNEFVSVLEAAETLTKHASDDDFKETIEALTRVSRLAKKADFEAASVDESLFENDAEKKFHDACSNAQKGYCCKSYEDKYQALHGLKGAISEYFDATMVMADDEKVKHNRLSQLVLLSNLTTAFGSLEELNVK